MSIEKLQEYLKAEKLTIEQLTEANDILADLFIELGGKEVYVEEPADIDDEVVQIWTEAQLNKLREAAVVAIANEMGIDASIRDAKADTVQKILDKQKKE